MGRIINSLYIVHELSQPERTNNSSCVVRFRLNNLIRYINNSSYKDALYLNSQYLLILSRSFLQELLHAIIIIIWF